MPRRTVTKPGTAEQEGKRIREILRILDRTYPNATCALNHRNAWELLVATILSAQCTDKRVNEVTPGLFEKYPTVHDFAAANQTELAQDIRSTGFFNNKARALIGAARKIIADFGGQVPRTMEETLTIPGCARKTANVVLNTWWRFPAQAVDTHIFRLGNRTGLAPGKTPLEVEKKLLEVVPERFRKGAHHWLILHGRYLCTARKPACERCPIADLCEHYRTVGGGAPAGQGGKGS